MKKNHKFVLFFAAGIIFFRDVRIDVMKLIKKFPPEEKYALTDGMRRASDEEYITKSEYSNGRILIKRALGLLNGYINYLIKAKSNYKKDSNMLHEDIVTYNQ
ncbi:MAG: hypothetical protein KAV45_00435 [Calditrichia bacterium]|jgi:hypothetical protein|nr:hypothetical protein [Calditrichia bacterium]